ncbi:MAG: hypothetical protein V1647_02675 [Pseudomonadota bacterium]
MIPIIFELNKVLKNKILWLIPALIFILILASRLSNISILNSAIWALAVLVSLVAIIVLTAVLFPLGDELKYEVISYKKLGAGLAGQYLIKFAVLTFFTVLFYVMFSFIKWSFDWRVMLAAVSLSCFLFAAMAAGVYAGTRAVYYAAVVLVFVSVLYPLYILPNLAYMLNANAFSVVIYSAVYLLLYFFTGFIFYVSAWRKQCIGWLL